MQKPSLTDLQPSCERCRHWRELTDSGDKERYGECRRFPPVPVMDEDGLHSIRPLTGPEEICGEFGAGQ